MARLPPAFPVPSEDAVDDRSVPDSSECLSPGYCSRTRARSWCTAAKVEKGGATGYSFPDAGQVVRVEDDDKVKDSPWLRSVGI